MGRFDDLRNRVAELIDNRSSDPEPRGYAGDDQPTGTIFGSYLEQNPDKDELQEYWELYQKVSLIRGTINNFASEVVEPGWYITADDQETADELHDYMENVAIVNLRHDQNFSDLAKKMVIEREVRGTVFVEKVTDDEGRHQALYPLQNDTITVYTKVGKAMLPAPDDDMAEPRFEPDLGGGEARVPRTDAGETGAFVQFDDLKPRWSAREEVVYTRDEIVTWPRNPDVGHVRGISRVRSIQDRAEGWLQKVHDNDAAIRSKAWPMIIFNLGTEENPWTRDQAKEFLNEYEDENLEPGMMQAVSGDVSVEEFAGETADIDDALQHDISAMMAGLPGPVYATGGFSQNVAPAVAQAQQRQYIKEVKETRRELENKITPYLREVAEDYDLDNPESVEFHIARPQGEVPPEDVSGSIIRYTSDADPANQGSPNAGAQAGGAQNATNEGGSGAAAPQPGDANDAPNTSMADSAGGSPQSSNTGFARNDYVPDDGEAEELFAHDHDADDLADPRFVATSEYEGNLSDVVAEALVAVRDEALQEFRQQYEQAPIAGAASFDGIARRAMVDGFAGTNIETETRSILRDVVRDTINTMNQDNHGPQLNVPSGPRHRQRARMLAENVDNSVQDAAEDMVDDMQTQVRRAAQRGEPSDAITDRIREQFSTDELRQRARIISHMELQTAVNTTKLVEYDRSPKVDGVRIINTCGDDTTPLCRTLAGCGSDDAVIAWFDVDETVSEQFEQQVTDEMLFDGFDPLPTAPPFHFGCTSELVPATRNNDND